MPLYIKIYTCLCALKRMKGNLCMGNPQKGLSWWLSPPPKQITGSRPFSGNRPRQLWSYWLNLKMSKIRLSASSFRWWHTILTRELLLITILEILINKRHSIVTLYVKLFSNYINSLDFVLGYYFLRACFTSHSLEHVSIQCGYHQVQILAFCIIAVRIVSPPKLRNND